MPPRLIPYKNATILLLDNRPSTTSELPQCTHVFVKSLRHPYPDSYLCYIGNCTTCAFKGYDCYSTSNNFFKSVNSPLKRLS